MLLVQAPDGTWYLIVGSKMRVITEADAGAFNQAGVAIANPSQACVNTLVAALP